MTDPVRIPVKDLTYGDQYWGDILSPNGKYIVNGTSMLYQVISPTTPVPGNRTHAQVQWADGALDNRAWPSDLQIIVRRAE